MQWDLADYSEHPIDGDASQIEACSGQLAEVAGDIRDQIDQLRELNAGELWESAAGAHEMFQDVIDDLPEKLEVVFMRGVIYAGLAAVPLGLIVRVVWRSVDNRYRNMFLTILASNAWITASHCYVINAKISLMWLAKFYSLRGNVFMSFVVIRDQVNGNVILCVARTPRRELFRNVTPLTSMPPVTPLLIAGNPYESAVATTLDFDSTYFLEPFTPEVASRLRRLYGYRKEVKPYLEYLTGRYL